MRLELGNIISLQKSFEVSAKKPVHLSEGVLSDRPGERGGATSASEGQPTAFLVGRYFTGISFAINNIKQSKTQNTEAAVCPPLAGVFCFSQNGGGWVSI